MATTKRPTAKKSGEGGDVSGNGWDWTPGPPNLDETPAAPPMPKRAQGLPTQNGGKMRDVFAYLLDEDAAPPPAAPAAPPAPAAKKKR
jgi:hypothetical protein